MINRIHELLGKAFVDDFHVEEERELTLTELYNLMAALPDRIPQTMFIISPLDFDEYVGLLCKQGLFIVPYSEDEEGKPDDWRYIIADTTPNEQGWPALEYRLATLRSCKREEIYSVEL